MELGVGGYESSDGSELREPTRPARSLSAVTSWFRPMNSSIPELTPAGQKAVDSMIESAQPLVPDDESVRYAWAVKKGIGTHPLMMATWFTQVLIVFQQFRVVAVTDSAIYVFKAGWFRRHHPKRLLRTVPRESLDVDKGGKVVLGPETVRVERRYWPVLLAAGVAIHGRRNDDGSS